MVRLGESSSIGLVTHIHIYIFNALRILDRLRSCLPRWLTYKLVRRQQLVFFFFLLLLFLSCWSCDSSFDQGLRFLSRNLRHYMVIDIRHHFSRHSSYLSSLLDTSSRTSRLPISWSKSFDWPSFTNSSIRSYPHFRFAHTRSNSTCGAHVHFWLLFKWLGPSSDWTKCLSISKVLRLNEIIIKLARHEGPISFMSH